jgi:hypothetical protein
MTCAEVLEQASERLDGHLGPLACDALDRHLAGCEGCRVYVGQLEVTRLALRRLPPDPVPGAMREALLARFDALADARRGEAPAEPAAEAPSRRLLLPGLVGTLVVLGAIVAAGRDVSRAPADVVALGALAAAALAVAALALRLGARVAVVGVAAAALAALAAGRGGPLVLAEGLECLSVELAGAAAVAAFAWSGARRAPPDARRRLVAGAAVAGALAADAGLQLTCGAHLALAHLAAFHLAGVAAVAAAAARLVHGSPRASRA